MNKSWIVECDDCGSAIEVGFCEACYERLSDDFGKAVDLALERKHVIESLRAAPESTSLVEIPKEDFDYIEQVLRWVKEDLAPDGLKGCTAYMAVGKLLNSELFKQQGE